MVPIIRRARLKDLDTLKKFQQQLANHERPFDSGIPKKGHVEYYDIKALINGDNSNFLVAEIGNIIVGCGFGQIRKNERWAVNKNFGYIGLIFIDDKFRCQNIGKLIVDALLKWFKEKDISDIMLKVYEKNISAVNAYKKYGFKDFILEMQYSL